MRRVGLLALLLAFHASADVLSPGGADDEDSGSGTVSRPQILLSTDFRTWGATAPTPFTYTRTGNQTIVLSGVMSTVAANVPAIDTTNGILLETASTNLALRSEALDNAAWGVVAGMTVTANQGVFIDGATTMEKLDNTGTVGATVYQGITASSSAGPWVFSVWVRPVNASDVATVGFQCGAGGPTVSTCTCRREDGGTCTTENVFSTTACQAYGTYTAITRAWVQVTCSGAITDPIPYVNGGRRITSAGTIYAGGAQLERRSDSAKYATGYIATAGTTAARGGTLLSAPSPLSATDPFCVDETLTPTNLHPYSVEGASLTILQGGTPFGANSFDAYLGSSGNLFWRVYDATATDKQTNSSSLVADYTLRKVTLCYPGDGTLPLYKDGTAATPSYSGAGTGVLGAIGSTIYLGGNGISLGVDGYRGRPAAG